MAVNFCSGIECVRAPGPVPIRMSRWKSSSAEHLLHVGQQAVNFIDEKDLAGLDATEDAGEVELLLQDRARGLLEADLQLLGNDGG
jgi:hypothetical protein